MQTFFLWPRDNTAIPSVLLPPLPKGLWMRPLIIASCEEPLVPILEKVLDARADHAPFPEDALGAAAPRPGTVSPWSSRVKEILLACGLGDQPRIEYARLYGGKATQDFTPASLYDRMTEHFYPKEEISRLFLSPVREKPRHEILALDDGSLDQAEKLWGIFLDGEDRAWIRRHFSSLGRNPTVAEALTFACVNSEHCRHKAFRARWILDGLPFPRTPWEMITSTFEHHPEGVISAFSDNAAILQGGPRALWVSDGKTWQEKECEAYPTLKGETHNHPTAVSPDPGAATGAGGEIRDLAAVGQGGSPVAGVVGYITSHLFAHSRPKLWERERPRLLSSLATPLEIALCAPLGASRYNNEFGRPVVSGFFRTFEEKNLGYFKPVMFSGGLGTVLARNAKKLLPRLGDVLVVLGGPAMPIGLGGASASSLALGEQEEHLDFRSVQRADAEMQRGVQDALERLLVKDNHPILALHDVGAGGLATAVSELARESGLGVEVDLALVPSADPGMSFAEIWACEAQERYVAAVSKEKLQALLEVAALERCPVAAIGAFIAEKKLIVRHNPSDTLVLDLPLEILFPSSSRVKKDQRRQPAAPLQESLDDVDLLEAAQAVLSFPSVGDKTFLVTICDRSVGARVARDPMVGPWQMPVADCALVLDGDEGFCGSAIALGERPPVAASNPQASVRLAAAEALTNLLAAPVPDLSKVRLGANWMAALGQEGQGAALVDAAEALSSWVASLGMAIVVGKDSLSMEVKGKDFSVSSPLTLVVTATAPIADVREALTPQLLLDAPSLLLGVDLSLGQGRLGQSAFCQAMGKEGGACPDVEDPGVILRFSRVLAQLKEKKWLLAYHDRSDGGFFATLAEMAFASRSGLRIDLDDALASLRPGEEKEAILRLLFCEEGGAVLQVPKECLFQVQEIFAKEGLSQGVFVLGAPSSDDQFLFSCRGKEVLFGPRELFQSSWSDTSLKMRELRDGPDLAQEERRAISSGRGLFAEVSFLPSAPYLGKGNKPKVAIFREEGTNGAKEMAAAFSRAGFACADVSTQSLLMGKVRLEEFSGLVACGGFSFGDVLGAGKGWAKSILFHPELREAFSRFFSKPEVFALGVCNGCQLFSHLKPLIPGSKTWPGFFPNRGKSFEARLLMVEIPESPSIFFRGMAGAKLPIVVSHAEGRAVFASEEMRQEARPLVAMRYLDGDAPAILYPANPNGSEEAVAGMSNADGRITILMPHPERLARTANFSWIPPTWKKSPIWGEHSPWMEVFANARKFVLGH